MPVPGLAAVPNQDERRRLAEVSSRALKGRTERAAFAPPAVGVGTTHVHSMFSFGPWLLQETLSSAGLETFALACHSAMSLLYLACIAVKASPPSANP